MLYFVRMHIFAFHKKQNKVNKKGHMTQKAGDAYQDSLNILGKEQFKKMLEKGLQLPIALL